MSLFEKLQKATSEEDVKDTYIKALHLKGVQRNLIDIQTKEVWFEAKLGSKVSLYAMFTQLLFYINRALKDGEQIPPFLCVVDSAKAAIMKTEVALPLLQNKDIKIKWGKSASDVTTDALDAVSQYIGTHFVSFNIETHEEEFISTLQNAIKNGEIIRTQITPDNLKQVFDKWVEKVGKEIVDAKPEDYAVLFFADIMSDGEIDYKLTSKIPESLQKVIADANEGKKKLLVLINPPYAEATNANNTAIGTGAKNKSGVANTKWNKVGMDKYGKASNELFTQFVARIAKEIPSAILAMFSKLKYINAPNFETFRNEWSAKYLDGFVVHSKSFEGLKGDFPIGFLIWKTINDKAKTGMQSRNSNEALSKKLEIPCLAYDRKANLFGAKIFFPLNEDNYLSKWINRPKANNKETIPLSNAVTPISGKAYLKYFSDNALGYLCSKGNDMQNAPGFTLLVSSVYANGHGLYVTEENLWQASIVFTVRKIIDHTWLNDRDQFLQPNCELSEEFKNDCLVWMLFNGSNLTASANNLEWNNQKWSIVNHFIPFTEEQVGASDKFESDFMVRYMEDKSFSGEAKAVLDEGLKIWQAFFKQDFNRKIRDAYKLNRQDVGWYQIRMALKAQNESGALPKNFSPFEAAYKALTEKLRPKIYEHGFLK